MQLAKIKDRLRSFSLFYLYIIVFCIRALETMLPYKHGDPLYYHLVGPKVWYQTSWLEMWKDVSHFAPAGIFDLVYIIPFYFTSSLMWVQISGQFLHFFCSIGVGSIICFRLIPHKIWGPLAAIAMLTLSKDGAFFLYAGNDGVVALAALVAGILVFKEDYSLKKVVLIGFFLGLTPSVKMNGLMFIVPLALYFTYVNLSKKQYRNVFIAVAVALVSFTPALIKNYIVMGNLLYPALISKFPGNMTPPMLAHYQDFYGNPLELKALGHHLKDFFMGKIIFLIFPILLFVNTRLKIRKLNGLAYSSLFIFIMYLIYNGSLVHARYFFACFFLLVYFIFQSLYQLDQRDFTPLKKYYKVMVFVIFALVFADSKIDKSLSRIKKAFIVHSSLSEKEIIRQEIPLTNFWDKVKSQGEMTYIITDNFSNSYYLPQGIRLHTAILSFGSEFLMDCQTENGLQKLRKYSYAILNQKLSNLCYNQILERGQVLDQMEGYTLYEIW